MFNMCNHHWNSLQLVHLESQLEANNDVFKQENVHPNWFPLKEIESATTGPLVICINV